MLNLLTKLSLLFLFLFPNFSLTLATDNISTIYSDVITDLSIDDDFNINDFPSKNENILDIISIAESIDDELFIYIYNPSKKLVPDSVNISQGIEENYKAYNYDLVLLSEEETLSKWLVKDIKILDDVVRYYSISTLQRKFDSSIDVNIGDNVSSTKSCNISKRFTAITFNGVVNYSVIEEKTIEIIDKHVGFIRYVDSWAFAAGYTDSHYVAFNTDLPIDYLYEVDISYKTIDKFETFYVWGTQVEEKNEKVIDLLTITSEEKGDNNPILAKKYEWERIQKVDDMIEEVDSSTKDIIRNMEWCLRFTETGYTETYSSNIFINGSRYSTIVSDVMLLRLKFMYDGKTYNLGVVDNKQSGDEVPDGSQNGLIDFSGLSASIDKLVSSFNEIGSWIKVIFIIAIIILFVFILNSLVSTASALGKFLSSICRFICSIPRYIYNLIALIFKVILLPINIFIFLFVPKKNRKYVEIMSFKRKGM